MRKLLVDAGFKLVDGKFTSPLAGHTPVAVLYALMVWGISHNVLDLATLLADCACAAPPCPPPYPSTHPPPRLGFVSIIATRTHLGHMKCRSPAEPTRPTVLRYGLMRLATHGTGDLTRMTDEQRAAGQQRGHTILQESRDHSAAVYSIFEALHASPGMVIVFEIVISLAAIGREEPLRRVITLAGVECSNRAAFAAGEFKKFLDDLWYILNQGVGRTAYQVITDQARNRSPGPAALLPRHVPD